MNPIRIHATNIGTIVCYPRQREPMGHEPMPSHALMATWTYPGGRLYNLIELTEIVNVNDWRMG